MEHIKLATYLGVLAARSKFAADTSTILGHSIPSIPKLPQPITPIPKPNLGPVAGEIENYMKQPSERVVRTMGKDFKENTLPPQPQPLEGHIQQHIPPVMDTGILTKHPLSGTARGPQTPNPMGVRDYMNLDKRPRNYINTMGRPILQGDESGPY